MEEGRSDDKSEKGQTNELEEKKKTKKEIAWERK